MCDPLIPGALINCKLIGALETTDENGEDNKFIFVPINKVSNRSKHIDDLDDLISAVTKTTGFGKGLFVGLEPKEGQKQRSREVKVQYLDRLIICIGLGLGRPVDCVPSHVVAGSESEKTNRMLQHLAKVATDEKLNFDSLVERTLNGDKPKGHEVQQKLAKERKNGVFKIWERVINPEEIE